MIKEWPDEEAGPRGSRRPWEAPSIAPGGRPVARQLGAPREVQALPLHAGQGDGR